MIAEERGEQRAGVRGILGRERSAGVQSRDREGAVPPPTVGEWPSASSRQYRPVAGHLVPGPRGDGRELMTDGRERPKAAN